MKRHRILSAALLLTPLGWAAPDNTGVFDRIRSEAFEHSRVMDHLFYLTDVYGPRLTGSPAFRQAAEWAVKRFQQFGIPRAHLESWEGFGRGWWCRNFEAHLEKPRYAPLTGFALPWSPGTDGEVRGSPVSAVITSEADLPRFDGKLRGAIVLLDSPRIPGWRTAVPPQRYNAEALEEVRLVPDDMPPFEFLPRSPDRIRSRAGQFAWRDRLHRFLREQGVRLVIREARGGEYGSTYGTAEGSPDPSSADPPPAIVLAVEHYNRLYRLAENKDPVELAVLIEAGFEKTGPSTNVIAEIPGRGRPEEVVMLGAHLDSWTGGTGATDNAAGCAVVLEAMRILQTLTPAPERTVRAALWSGEEQGILGSQAYLRALGKPQQERISVYFNYDFGAGRIRGIYLQNNDAARPVLTEWLEPWKDLGASTVSIRNGGGTDHLSFDAVGIPAFAFIQDPLEYGWKTHHTSMDTFERVPAADAMQSAAVLAGMVYQAATAAGRVPRKPRPSSEAR